MQDPAAQARTRARRAAHGAARMDVRAVLTLWPVGGRQIGRIRLYHDILGKTDKGDMIMTDETCGRPWVAEIELCPRCGKDAAVHSHLTRAVEDDDTAV